MWGDNRESNNKETGKQALVKKPEQELEKQRWMHFPYS